MLHACVERFDVMGGRGNILGWEGEVNKAILLENPKVEITGYIGPNARISWPLWSF
jgi:hypothetical protein